MRNKYSSVAVEALHRPSLYDYVSWEFLKTMREHQMFEFLLYVTGLYSQTTPVHTSAQKALPNLRERITLPSREGEIFGAALISARVLCLNGRLNVEMTPSDAARKSVSTTGDGLYDPNQMEIDELMFALSDIEYDFDNDEPLF